MANGVLGFKYLKATPYIKQGSSAQDRYGEGGRACLTIHTYQMTAHHT